MYMIRHNRATDTRHFGPFETLAEVDQFLDEHPDVRPYVFPLTKTVDWNETDVDVFIRLNELEEASDGG